MVNFILWLQSSQRIAGKYGKLATSKFKPNRLIIPGLEEVGFRRTVSQSACFDFWDFLICLGLRFLGQLCDYSLSLVIVLACLVFGIVPFTVLCGFWRWFEVFLAFSSLDIFPFHRSVTFPVSPLNIQQVTRVVYYSAQWMCSVMRRELSCHANFRLIYSVFKLIKFGFSLFRECAKGFCDSRFRTVANIHFPQ